MQKVTEDLFIPVRYNPFKDKGYDNNIYILPNYTNNDDNLEPLPDIDLQNPGFPNWLSCFGFQDYLIKLGKKSKINEHWIMIWKSKYFDPFLPYYIFVDHWFLHGDSEELEGRTGWDNVNWYPQVQHQQGELNTLALCGPGTPKLGTTKLAEAKIEYRFYFKVGGCGAPVEKVADPQQQPTYATPTNILDQNSLQSPEEPLETFLYQFDWRRNQITETAAKRITQDYSIGKSLFTDAATTGTEVPLHQTHEKDLLTSEEEETQKETLFQQLLDNRIKQQQLRQRIKATNVNYTPIRIKKMKCNINLFGNEQKNRRMNKWEYEQELQESKIWGHYPRTHILDKPFYKDMFIEPLVNFDLNFKK